MSSLFLKQFLKKPLLVASIVPSSKELVRRVVGRMDLGAPRVIVEYGPGEGCHTREIVRRMHPASRVVLFELEPGFARHLTAQFRRDPRVTVINCDAADASREMARLGHAHCDYLVSGIPLSLLAPDKKRELLRGVHQLLAAHDRSAFITYQVTNELAYDCRHFPRMESEYCLRSLPPMFVTTYFKTEGGRT